MGLWWLSFLASRKEKLVSVAVLVYMALFTSGLQNTALVNKATEWAGFSMFFLLNLLIIAVIPLYLSEYLPPGITEDQITK